MSNFSWYSLVFWVPASVVIFWVTVLAGIFIDSITRKYILDPLARLLNRLETA